MHTQKTPFEFSSSQSQEMQTTLNRMCDYEEKQDFSHKKVVTGAIFAVCFVFFAFAAWCVPLTSDDLEFAHLELHSLNDFLDYVLYYGNGRILGNITSVVLSQIPLLAILIKALVISSIIVLLPRVLGMSGVFNHLVSALLLIGISPALFGEVYSWTAGFSNYTVPILLVLLCIHAVKSDQGGLFWKSVRLLIIISCGLCAQLFVEHISVIHVLLAASALLYSLKYSKKYVGPSALWVAATVAGLVIMALIPKVFYVEGNHAEGYRSVNVNGIAVIFQSCVENVIALSNKFIGVNGLIIPMGLIVSTKISEESRSASHNKVFYWIGGISAGYILISAVLSADLWFGRLTIVHHAVSTVVILVSFFAWIAAAAKLKKNLRAKVLMLLLFAFASLAMFLVVSPVSTRVVYLAYIFMVCAIMYCLNDAIKKVDFLKILQIRSALTAAVAMLILVLTCVFGNIRIIANLREEYVNSQLESGESNVIFFTIPYDYVFWDNSTYRYRYQYYLNEPGDITFTVMDFETWRTNYLDTYLNSKAD